jgi:hypothetical protein
MLIIQGDMMLFGHSQFWRAGRGERIVPYH